MLDMKQPIEKQLIIDGRKCNASMTILFNDENDDLCVILQKNGKFHEWISAGGKVDELKDQDIPEILMKKFQNNKELAIFSATAVRESTEEQGYPLLEDLKEGKAEIYYFDRDANGMVEQNRQFRSEIFYAYLGKRSQSEVNQLIRPQGNLDSEAVKIVRTSDINIENLGGGKIRATLKDEPLPVRATTMLMLQKIPPLMSFSKSFTVMKDKALKDELGQISDVFKDQEMAFKASFPKPH